MQRYFSHIIMWRHRCAGGLNKKLYLRSATLERHNHLSIDTGTTFLCRLRSIATHKDHFVRRLSVCLSVCLSVFLSVRPSVCLSFCPSVHPSVCLSVRLSHSYSYVSHATHAFLGMLLLFLYGYSEKPPQLVAFYDTLEIRRTHSRLNSRVLTRGGGGLGVAPSHR